MYLSCYGQSESFKKQEGSIMKKMRAVCLPVVFCISLVFFSAALAGAAEQIGYVFDVQGAAEFKGTDGKTIKLKRSEHLLQGVRNGDRIKVGKGRVVVAVIKENKGYEISDNSEGIAKEGRIVAVRGRVAELKGLHAPGKATAGSIGGFVVRSVKPCIRAISPVSTTIIDLMPELTWENKCPGDKKVTVKIISGDNVLFSAESEGSSLKVPGKVLAYGSEYRWIVDSGKANNVSGGVFSLPAEEEAKTIRAKIDQFQERKQDLSFRFSYVFFLVDNNLNDMAKAQIKVLKADFPDNNNIKKMEEGIK